MSGTFNPVDPVRCAHYARFTSHLGRQEFDFIYWFLFSFVLSLLFLASYTYSREHERVQMVDVGSAEYKRRMRRCMYCCSGCFVVAVVAIVMEVFALLALQFCDGEDLMSLYWATWTTIQVGSIVAIFGIVLAVSNGLRGNKNPPWALALGTPVLVVAGIGHAVQVSMRKRVKRVRSLSLSAMRRPSVMSENVSPLEQVSTGGGLPISREATLRVDDSEREEATEFRATFVGLTPEGAPILRFHDDPGAIKADRGTVIGRADDGQVIVAFRKSMILVSGGPTDSKVVGIGNDGEDEATDIDAITPVPPSAVVGTGAEPTGAPGPSTPQQVQRPTMVRIATPPRPADLDV